jgi:hypothetical protein
VGVKPVQITGPGSPEGGPRPDCCIKFCLSRPYCYLSTVQFNPFIPSPGHSATDSQSFRCSVNVFSTSVHAGNAKNKITGAPTGSRRPCIFPLRHLRQYLCTVCPRSVCTCTVSSFLYSYCQSICLYVYSQSIHIYYAPSPAVSLPFSCSALRGPQRSKRTTPDVSPPAVTKCGSHRLNPFSDFREVYCKTSLQSCVD